MRISKSASQFITLAGLSAIADLNFRPKHIIGSISAQDTEESPGYIRMEKGKTNPALGTIPHAGAGLPCGAVTVSQQPRGRIPLSSRPSSPPFIFPPQLLGNKGGRFLRSPFAKRAG